MQIRKIWDWKKLDFEDIKDFRFIEKLTIGIIIILTEFLQTMLQCCNI